MYHIYIFLKVFFEKLRTLINLMCFFFRFFNVWPYGSKQFKCHLLQETIFKILLSLELWFFSTGLFMDVSGDKCC